MTKFQKIIFWRFLATGLGSVMLGFYFLINPENSYTGWIGFTVGNGSLLFALWWRNYSIEKNKKESKFNND